MDKVFSVHLVTIYSIPSQCLCKVIGIPACYFLHYLSLLSMPSYTFVLHIRNPYSAHHWPYSFQISSRLTMICAHKTGEKFPTQQPSNIADTPLSMTRMKMSSLFTNYLHLTREDNVTKAQVTLEK